MASVRTVRLKVQAPGNAAEAHMNETTIPLFRQPDGGRLGLMPIDAELALGDYPLEFLDSSGTVIQPLTVTVTDALPAGLTPVSMSGTGW